jgi:hypothetical protein
MSQFLLYNLQAIAKIAPSLVQDLYYSLSPQEQLECVAALPRPTSEPHSRRKNSLDRFMRVSSYFLAEAYEFWSEYKPLLDGTLEAVSATLAEISSPSGDEGNVTSAESEVLVAKEIVDMVIGILA